VRLRAAQLNIGIMKSPMGSPVMADFAANLERINALPRGVVCFCARATQGLRDSRYVATARI
jgi:Domain of unknown function (DUF3291)